MEQGATYWRRYLSAFVLMGVVAGATSLSAYLLGKAINEAYVDKNIPGIAMFSGIIFLLFLVRGIAIYGQTVTLSKISNAILANNQRRLFAQADERERRLLLRAAFVGISRPSHRKARTPSRRC